MLYWIAVNWIGSVTKRGGKKGKSQRGDNGNKRKSENGVALAI